MKQMFISGARLVLHLECGGWMEGGLDECLMSGNGERKGVAWPKVKHINVYFIEFKTHFSPMNITLKE